ncbi:hypothetical protein [Ruegeria sp. R14_0]|uniref:hypothetical protein n=1 Tax=Ruegeria sp. R14_0 TaxID=2821100 RepID=UPI001ADA406A|nr:hypothetical protein [Ruegeria sp. R14_0]MBO9446711.1 hypothetical protein [Ruegeria sp. R14_0]
MAVYPAAAAFLLLWLWLSVKNADNGVVMAIAMIPFGMFAAVVVGDLSILMANLLAVLSISLLVVRRAVRTAPGALFGLPPSGLYLLVFALYSVFSAIVLVRLFEGNFSVFPMTVTFVGPQVSIFFSSVMLPLQPSNSNIAQAIYILLSAAFFLSLVAVARRRGVAFAETGLVWAAALNAILGLLDFLQADMVLGLVRTADYALLNEHLIGQFSRVIGGYSEASGYGAASSAFFAYFAMSYLIVRKNSHGILAITNLIGALMALSSTGVVAVAGATFFVLLHFRVFLGFSMSRVFGHVLVLVLSVLAIFVSVSLLVPTVANSVSDVLDQLIYSKLDTLSGRERGAWSAAAFDAFVQTWGLGAGVGSLRGNGLASVLLGSVGVPGTVAFVLFLLSALGPPIRGADHEALRLYCAGRVCALTLLTAMLVSATTPDPGLFLMAATAICVAARERVFAQSAAKRINPAKLSSGRI